MLKFTAPFHAQYDLFLQMMWDDGQEYLQNALHHLQMTWDEYCQVFRTRGEVFAIYQDADLAGFYWIEERLDSLHHPWLDPEIRFSGTGDWFCCLNHAGR
jgi:hypothetical protein